MKNRNYGIDLLKCLSMFMVVMIHVMAYGGVLYTAPTGSASYWYLRGSEAFCYCCVNVFGMITGYLAYNRSFKYSSIMERWLQVFYYTFGLTFLFWILGLGNITSYHVVNSLLPVKQNSYWYFTVYFGMSFLIPYMNQLFNSLSEKQVKVLLLIIFCIFSCYPVICKYDAFAFGNGYSVIWLMVLYFFGASIAKYNLFSKLKAWQGIIIYIVLSLLTLYTSHLYFNTPEWVEKPYMLLTYTSPTMIINAVILVVLFSRIHVSSNKLQKLIVTMSTVSFGVYLFNEATVLRDNFLMNRLSFLLEAGMMKLVLGVIISCIVIYILGSIFDYIRVKFFQVLKVKQFCVVVTDKISIVVNKIIG